MPDTEYLKKVVRDFAFRSVPSNGDYSAPCTVGDLRKVISKLEEVLNAFISELEEKE